MKTWITLLLAATLSTTATVASASGSFFSADQSAKLDPSGIHPGTVNLLLGMAAEYLGVSQGQARQFYKSGRIQIQKLTINADAFIEVNYDGLCIILLLEDNL